MPGKNWLPGREQDLLDMISRWDLWLSDTDKREAFGWTADACSQVLLKNSEFTQARASFESANTTENRMAKDEAKELAIEGMQKFANSSIRFNDLMTVENKHYLGINRDTVRTHHPKPAVKPMTGVVPSGQGKQTVSAINPELQTKKKPDHVLSVAFASRVRLPTEPASAADEMPSISHTRATHDFQWSESDVGKIADYATAYENLNGRGPWSNVTSMVIS